jgi:hypothetical protein
MKPRITSKGKGAALPRGLLLLSGPSMAEVPPEGLACPELALGCLGPPLGIVHHRRRAGCLCSKLGPRGSKT